MYKLINIEKKYGNQTVFSKFNYQFKNTGLFVLFGPSGCGKTTLLNILAGTTKIDSGEIFFNNTSYESHLSWNDVKEAVGYMTQSTSLIDYLSLLDNMKLVCDDEQLINEYLNQYLIFDKKDQLAIHCSGGERQRAAIVQAILQNKKVLLFDEPTSALDSNNKTAFFKAVKQLSTEKLVIISSHDDLIKNYCDYIIDFNNLSSNQFEPEIPVEIHETKRKDILKPYLKKWFKSNLYNEKSNKIMVLIMSLMICMLCLCGTPITKLKSCMKDYYHLNQIKVYVNKDSLTEKVVELFNTDTRIIDCVLSYNSSVNIEELDKREFDYLSRTLPFKEDAFYYHDNLISGHWFEKENDIILSYDKAITLGTPNDLIGKSLTLNLYDGIHEMTIAGVLEKETNVQNVYYRCSDIVFDKGVENVYLNSQFTARYQEDSSFFLYNQRVYVLYFDNFESMYEFYNEYSNRFEGVIMRYQDIPYEVNQFISIVQILILPIVAMLLPLSIVLFQQTEIQQLMYNKQIITNYKYLGFKDRQVSTTYIQIDFLRRMLMLIKALAIAIIIMLIGNILNKVNSWIFFQLFTFEWQLIFMFVSLFIVMNLMTLIFELKKIGRLNWYDMVIEYEDVL